MMSEAARKKRLRAKRAEVTRLEQLLTAAGLQLQLQVPPPRETIDHESDDVTQQQRQQQQETATNQEVCGIK